MKNECQEIQALLDRFIQEDLPPGESLRLQKHLDTCVHCQKVIEGEAWEQLLVRLPKKRCPDRVIRRVETAIHTEKKRLSVSRFHLRHWQQTVFAGLAVAALVIILVIRPQTREHQMTPPEYTQEEIEKAREAMRWTMVYTAQKMKKSETKAIDDVFTRHLPRSVQKSIRKVLPILQGE